VTRLHVLSCQPALTQEITVEMHLFTLRNAPLLPSSVKVLYRTSILRKLQIKWGLKKTVSFGTSRRPSLHYFERRKFPSSPILWGLPDISQFPQILLPLTILLHWCFLFDSLCGLVVRVPGYRSIGPGSIPGATRFSDKYWAWNGVHSAFWVQSSSYLKEKVAAPV
jgi:hypothetical protein